MSDKYTFLTTFFVGLFLVISLAVLTGAIHNGALASFATEKAEFELCVSNGGAWIADSKHLCLRHVDLP